MEHIPTVMSVMTPFPHAIAGDKTLVEARDMMTERKIHHLPVLRDGRIEGLISMRDIGVMSDNVEAWKDVPVASICAREPYVVEHSKSLRDAVVGVTEHHLTTILVTRAGKLVGILTTTDLCRLLADAIARLHPPDAVA